MLPIEKLTIDALLKQAFEKYADLPSIAFAGEKPMTYSELEKAVRERMEDLRAYGVEPGDRIVILGDNCPNWVIAYL
ncbi:AMP-binding protein, partial [bacterium]|nr:AMP-binding protein [bacterium]